MNYSALSPGSAAPTFFLDLLGLFQVALVGFGLSTPLQCMAKALAMLLRVPLAFDTASAKALEAPGKPELMCSSSKCGKNGQEKG
ncbi:MAG TPA: hypothetical protein VKE93_17265 [Candidatus Angelobacter sp.]|nr:hypothetical protein [Candidatus Angelobacter sp.]